MAESGAVPASAAQPALGAGGRWSRFLYRHAHVIFPAPAVVIVAAIIAYPVLYTVWMSLHGWFASSLTPPKFVALANYHRLLLADARFHEAFFRTLYFAALVVAAEAVLG